VSTPFEPNSSGRRLADAAGGWGRLKELIEVLET
jgi:hypothetical protein